MDDAQKSYKSIQVNDGRDDKVHIPESFEESNFDSETLSEKLRRIGAYEDGGQGCSKDGEITGQQQMWCMEGNIDMSLEIMPSKDVDALKNAIVIPDLVEEVNKTTQTVQHVIATPEVFLPNDHIVTTQESMVFEVNTQPSQQMQDQVNDEAQAMGQESNVEIVHQVKGRSERLKKDIAITTQEKMEVMSKKEKS